MKRKIYEVKNEKEARLISRKLQVDLQKTMKDEQGQGTTEYAILVGVLVVIAIVAIIVLGPQVENLWKAVTDGMGQLAGT